MTHTEQTPAEALAAIVGAGVARFEAALPAYAQRAPQETEPLEICSHLAVSADRQCELCLNCPLADCVGVGNQSCPIRIESRLDWKRRRELAKVTN